MTTATRVSLVLLALTGAPTAFADPAGAPAADPVATEVAAHAVDTELAIRKVFPALVRIYVVMEEGEDGRMKKAQGSGSGTIISEDGYVVTNHHVAGRGTRFVCTLSNRDEVDATLVGTDALADLAVLKLDLDTRRFKDQPLPVASFGDSDTLRNGDLVFAMGSPGGVSQSVTRGIVANTALIAPRRMGSLRLDGESVGELVRWIGHDAQISPGNSGGPLVNPQGEIIGVNEVGIAGLGGAIPSNLAKQVVAELIAHGKVTRGWIGLEIQPLLRQMADEKGALVASVWKDSPAAAAGIQPGDFLLTYNGVPVPDCHADEDVPVFNAMVLGTAPGSKVAVTGRRGEEAMSWEVAVAEREPTVAKEIEAREWGLTIRDFTTISALARYRPDKTGVLVHTVRGGGPSAVAKPALFAADIITAANGKPVANCEEFMAVTAEFTKDLKEPKPMLVELERGTQRLATVVKVGPPVEPNKPKIAEKAWLGATTQVITTELAEAMGIAGKKGVRVTAISPDSPAAKAGFRQGDMFFKLDGKVINARRPEDSEVFSELILAYPVDATIELEGLRDGESHKWSVPLAPSRIDDRSLEEYKDEMFEFTARDLTAVQRDHAKEKLGVEPSGAAVLRVEASGWAALGGLAPEDIILTIGGKDVADVPALKEMLLGFRETKPRSVVFGIRRGPRTMFLEIEPRW